MFHSDSSQSQTTVDAGRNFDISKPDTRAATVVVTNSGAKSAKVQLQGSIRGKERFQNVGSEETVASGASKVFSVTDYWPYLRVVAKPASAGEQTTIWVESASTDS